MVNTFSPPSLEQLLKYILKDLNSKSEIFGISEKLFYKPWFYHVLYTKSGGKFLHNPLGLASGPHTQLAQNIVAGWLCGARFIELKTVNETNYTKQNNPSIDVPFEGYNCGSSHELPVREVFDQYLNAWILIHILHNRLYKSVRKDVEVGTVFNMSLGSSLIQVRSEEILWFIDKMMNCSEELENKIKTIKNIYPSVTSLKIPTNISNSVTLSVEQGSVPREIEYVVKYLMMDKKLHTTLKLNPTLLGVKSIRALLNKNRGYDVHIPDSVFDDNLQYVDLIDLISKLQKTADEMKLELNFKVSNALNCLKESRALPKDENLFISGAALHPVAVNLAANLQTRFEGNLNLSFSGGVDYYNVANLIKCGFKTITVCTDLLKPGGYGRLAQYFDSIYKEFVKVGARNIFEYTIKTSNEASVLEASLEHLKDYAIYTLSDKRYQRDLSKNYNIKTSKKLYPYDCIEAPCVSQCSVNQDVPSYLWFAAKHDINKSFSFIIQNNPFPSITGSVCDHLCKTKCTRINYDEPVKIREVKRYVSEKIETNQQDQPITKKNEKKICVIGGGISGLSCAWFLNQAGFAVDVFEADAYPGGMVVNSVPAFRLEDKSILRDIERIRKSGVNIITKTVVNSKKFLQLRKKYDSVFISTGFQVASISIIDGTGCKNIFEAIDFLKIVKQNKNVELGQNVAVFGGGNHAVDAARTAQHLLGANGVTSLVCQYTINDIKADKEEVAAMIEEGVNIVEMVFPIQIIREDNHVKGLEYRVVEQYETNKNGHIKPLKISKTIHSLEFDTIIFSGSYSSNINFVEPDQLKTKEGSLLTRMENVYIGGGARLGETTLIKAIADGRNAALEIMKKENILQLPTPEKILTEEEIAELLLKKNKREIAVKQKDVPIEERNNFEAVIHPLTKTQAIYEAKRCLQCDVICNVCVSVCPNNAFIGFEIKPEELLIPTINYNNDNFKVSKKKRLDIKQKYQVICVADWCNECGNCTTFCPTAGTPYKDKNRLHFDKAAFKNEGRGFLLSTDGDLKQLIMKKDGKLSVLSLNWDALIFENDDCMAVLDKNTFEIEHIDIFTDSKRTFDLPEITEMKIIFNAVENLV